MSCITPTHLLSFLCQIACTLPEKCIYEGNYQFCGRRQCQTHICVDKCSFSTKLSVLVEAQALFSFHRGGTGGHTKRGHSNFWINYIKSVFNKRNQFWVLNGLNGVLGPRCQTQSTPDSVSVVWQATNQVRLRALEWRRVSSKSLCRVGD